MKEKFLQYMKNNALSENTYKSYANDIKLFEQYYKDSYGENLTNLTHADISMYLNYLLKHSISPITINRKLSAIKMYNLFLVESNIQNDIVINDKDYIKIQKTIINKEIPSWPIILV